MRLMDAINEYTADVRVVRTHADLEEAAHGAVHLHLHARQHLDATDEHAGEQRHMRPRIARDGPGALAELHTEEVGNGRNGSLDGLVRKLERLDHLAVRAGRLPRALELLHLHLGNEIRGANLKVLERVVLFESVAECLLGGRVNFARRVLQLAGERCRWETGRRVASQADVRRRRDVACNARGRDNRNLLPCIGLGCFHRDRHVHQHLLRDSVGNVELKDDVIREDVAHAVDHILEFGLGELGRARGAKQRPQRGKRGNLVQVVGVARVCRRGSPGGPARRAESRPAVTTAGPTSRCRGLLCVVDNLDVRQRLERERSSGRAQLIRMQRLCKRSHRQRQRTADKRAWRSVPCCPQQRKVESSPVAHLVVLIVQRTGEKRNDAGPQPLHTRSKLRQGRHRRRSYRCVLENHTVVDESNEAPGLRRCRTSIAEQVKDAGGQLRVLAVLDELAELEQPFRLGVGDLVDQFHHAVQDSFFEIVAALLPQGIGQVSEEQAVLRRVTKAQLVDGADNRDPELVGDLGHEGHDLLHVLLDTGLGPCLEQRRNRERGNRAVRVSDQALEVVVALGHQRRVRHRDFAERLDSGEAQRRLGRGQEQVQNRDGRRKVARHHLGQRADGACRLVHDHLAAFLQARLQELVRGTRIRRRHVLVQKR
mmetsp:Transcript_23320/g.81280  ORF Transcript_23320/g.81280 Transcript_23320/m.81280 type:complete len:654 (-) Transcript_23320:970-2931(-)